MPSGAAVLVAPGLSEISHSSQLNPDRQEQQQLYNSIQADNSEQNSLTVAVPMGQQSQVQQQPQVTEPQRPHEPRNTFLSNEAPLALHEQER